MLFITSFVVVTVAVGLELVLGLEKLQIFFFIASIHVEIGGLKHT